MKNFERKYDLKPQKKDNYCICSVIQAIFDKHGNKISQKQISRELTPSKKGFYVDDEKFKFFLMNNGFEYEYLSYNQTPFNEPDMLLREINNKDIFMGWDNHSFLVVNFKDPTVSFINPENGKIKKLGLHQLMRNMADKGDGFFGLIRKVK